MEGSPSFLGLELWEGPYHNNQVWDNKRDVILWEAW